MEDKNYAIAKFRFSLPKGVVEPKALLILVPGSNSDGRYQVDDPIWVKLAKRQNLALCGCFFADFKPGTEEDYCKVSLGSGQALLDAIEQAGYGHLPILMWGFSAGGQFNYEFNAWKPERVMGFVVNKGGVYFTGLNKPESRVTPGLFFLGTLDEPYRRFMIAGLYYLNRACGGCNWQLIMEKCHHSICDSETLSVEFFEDLLEGKG